MSAGEWVDDDEEERVDFSLWRKLLGYTLQYRKTSIMFTFVALFTAASDLRFRSLLESLSTMSPQRSSPMPPWKKRYAKSTSPDTCWAS